MANLRKARSWWYNSSIANGPVWPHSDHAAQPQRVTLALLGLNSTLESPQPLSPEAGERGAYGTVAYSCCSLIALFAACRYHVICQGHRGPENNFPSETRRLWAFPGKRSFFLKPPGNWLTKCRPMPCCC